MPIRGKPPLQYLAGLFDGEGTINVGRHIRSLGGWRYQVNVQLKMTTQRHVMFFHARWPGTTFSYEPGGVNDRTQHCWAISGRKAQAFLREIYPFLDLKAPQAELAISLQDLMTCNRNGVPPENNAMRAKMWRDMRSLNGTLKWLRHPQRLSEETAQESAEAIVQA